MALTSGTRIATPEGTVAVEDLRPGASVLTAGGAVRQVRWVGERVLFGRFIPPLRRSELFPIRIPAGVLGGGMPLCDMLVSPAQLLCFENVLVPAGLVLGCDGISQVAPPENPADPMANAIRYFDVELHEHDVMLAASAPAASYLCRGDRNKFRNVVDFFRRYGADTTEPPPCLPVVVSGPGIDAVRARIGGMSSAPVIRLATRGGTSDGEAAPRASVPKGFRSATLH